MKALIFSFAAIFFLFTVKINAQGLAIQPDAWLITAGDVIITIENDNFINNSIRANFTSSKLYMTGDNTKSISGTGTNVFKNLYINKGTGKLLLKSNISVNGKIIMQSGNLDLNGKNAVLASAAFIQGETEVKRIIGSKGGEVQITLNMNAPASQNAGNLGATITSAANLGSVTIARGYKVQTNNGTGKSIKRYYIITPANNSSLNATLRFTYLNAEVNGLTESDFSLWRSTDHGSTWINKSFTTRSASNNYVELTGIKTFGARFTLTTSTFSFGSSEEVSFAEKKVRRDLSKIFTVQLFPNPVTNTQASIQINAGYAVKANVLISATDGKMMLKVPVALHAGVNQLPLNAAKFMSGSYIIILETEDGIKRTLTFVK